MKKSFEWKSRKKLMCPKCPAIYTRKGLMERHLQNHANDAKVECHKCLKFIPKSSFDYHLLVHDGPPFICTVCGKEFKNKDSFVSCFFFVDFCGSIFNNIFISSAKSSQSASGKELRMRPLPKAVYFKVTFNESFRDPYQARESVPVPGLSGRILPEEHTATSCSV